MARHLRAAANERVHALAGHQSAHAHHQLGTGRNAETVAGRGTLVVIERMEPFDVDAGRNHHGRQSLLGCPFGLSGGIAARGHDQSRPAQHRVPTVDGPAAADREWSPRRRGARRRTGAPGEARCDRAGRAGSSSTRSASTRAASSSTSRTSRRVGSITLRPTRSIAERLRGVELGRSVEGRGQHRRVPPAATDATAPTDTTGCRRPSAGSRW